MSAERLDSGRDAVYSFRSSGHSNEALVLCPPRPVSHDGKKQLVRVQIKVAASWRNLKMIASDYLCHISFQCRPWFYPDFGLSHYFRLQLDRDNVAVSANRGLMIVLDWLVIIVQLRETDRSGRGVIIFVMAMASDQS